MMDESLLDPGSSGFFLELLGAGFAYVLYLPAVVLIARPQPTLSEEELALPTHLQTEEVVDHTVLRACSRTFDGIGEPEP